MALWIESHCSLGGHKKLYKLCKELKIEAPQAVGHLHYLWWWAIQNRTDDGDLIGLFPKDIAMAGRWEGNPQKFVKALEICGFIQNSKIKDWMDYAGHLLKSRQRKRQYQERSENVPGTFQERQKNAPPNQTVPYRTQDIKTRENNGFLSKKDEKIVLKDIADHMGWSPEAEATRLRLNEIVFEISKIKDVKNPVAMARHKAINQ